MCTAADSYELILRIWQREEIPETGKENIIIPFHEKGDKGISFGDRSNFCAHENTNMFTNIT